MRDEMSPTVRGQILNKYFRRRIWNPSKYDGANLAYQAPMAMIDGLLRGDTARIRSVVSSVYRRGAVLFGRGYSARPVVLSARSRAASTTITAAHYGMVFAQRRRPGHALGGGHRLRLRRRADRSSTAVHCSMAWSGRRGATRSTSPRWAARSPSPDRSTAAAPCSATRWPIWLPLGRRTRRAAGRRSIATTIGISETNFLSGNKVVLAGRRHGPPAAGVFDHAANALQPHAAARNGRRNNMRGFLRGRRLHDVRARTATSWARRASRTSCRCGTGSGCPGTTVEHNGVIP